MRVERQCLRLLGIIKPRPAGYDDVDGRSGKLIKDFHEEIWPEDPECAQYHEILEAKFVSNGDEIPFTFNMVTKQIMTAGEHAALARRSMRFADKYRKGTIFVISNFRTIQLVVIIFPKGGRGGASLR